MPLFELFVAESVSGAVLSFVRWLKGFIVVLAGRGCCTKARWRAGVQLEHKYTKR